MNVTDLPAFCAANTIDLADADAQSEHGAGWYLHWRNPADATDGECIHVTPDALEAVTPAELLRQVINGRDVRHMTRIVGYFSNIENWNKSKQGELKDRHKGDYRVKEEQKG